MTIRTITSRCASICIWNVTHHDASRHAQQADRHADHPTETDNLDEVRRQNREGKRDPEMTQTMKGNQWHFGMKAHIGVDDESSLVHTDVGATAKDSDTSQFTQLLHGEETRASADLGYDYPHIHAHLQDMTANRELF